MREPVDGSHAVTAGEWVCWEDGAGSPWWNLALDEALFSSVARRGGTGVAGMRLYRWDRGAVSVGYGFPRAQLEDLLEIGTRPVVRRITGGGAVEHGSDLTLALFIPDGRLATRSAAGVYRWVHRTIADQLGRGGAGGAEMFPRAGDGPARGSACFSHPVRDDVLVAGCKVAGGAIRRTRDGLLYQGSIQGEGIEFGGLGARVAAALAPDGFRIGELGVELTDAASRIETERYRAETWLGRC